MSKDTREKHFRKRCFQHYTKPELLQKHVKFCSTYRELAIPKMPEPGTEIEFKNFERQLPMPFVIYADFESFIIPYDKCDPNPKESYSVSYQKHIPCGFCLYVKSLDEIKKEIIKDNIFIYTNESNDENIAEIFVKKIKEIAVDIHKRFYKNEKYKEPIYTDCSRQDIRNATHYYLVYRGAAHKGCNSSCKNQKYYLLYFTIFKDMIDIFL